MAITHPHEPSSDSSGPDPTSSILNRTINAGVDYRLLVKRATGRPIATAVLNQRPGVAYRHGPQTGPLAEWGIVDGRCVLVVTNPDMARHLVNEIIASECDDCGAPTDPHRLDRTTLTEPALRCDDCSAAHHAAELASYRPDSSVTCSMCAATWAAGEVAERGWCGSTTLGSDCHSSLFDGFDVEDLASALAVRSTTTTVGWVGVGVEQPY